jgi:hypothetical protein
VPQNCVSGDLSFSVGAEEMAKISENQRLKLGNREWFSPLVCA